MRILVIGGTRFIGYHLVWRFLQDGHEVTIFHRGLTPDDFGSAVKRIYGDRRQPQEFRSKLKGLEFDVVVDMIAYRGEESRQVVNILSGRVGHFIHISTGSVYIVTRDYPCPLREEDFNREVVPRPSAQDEWWVYGVNKRDCEVVLQEAFAVNQFPVTIFRLPIVMGERDYTLRAYSYFLRIVDGGPLLLPDAGLNVFTHIYQGDVVKTIARNLLNAKSFGQVYNLAMEEIISLRSFVQKASAIIGKKVEVIDIPSALLDELPCGSSISPFSQRRPFVLAVDKARRELSFSSTPVGVWLEKTIEWFFSQYNGPPPENYRWRALERQLAKEYLCQIDELKKKYSGWEEKNG